MKLGRWWKIVHMRLRSVARRTRVEGELDKELQFHLEQQTEENLALGMPRAEARRAALRRLGGMAQIQEECRDMRRTNYIENLWHDLHYALRMLAKSPGFTVVIVLTLALSIGANSAIFSVIDGVLLRPLPYPEADRIVRFFFHSATYPRFPLNPFDFRDFRTRNRSFDSLAGFTRGDLQLSGAGRPERFAGFRVTAGYFHVLGLRPARGREFNTNDELPGNGRVVILSDRLWHNRFAADPTIIGRKIMLDSQPFTVAGLMPPGTEHPGNEYHGVAHGDTVDLWWPFTFRGNPAQRGSHFLEVIGRLKSGITPPQAQAEMNGLIAQLAREHPDALEGWQALVIPLYQEIVGPTRRLLLVLLGAVGVVGAAAAVELVRLPLVLMVAVGTMGAGFGSMTLGISTSASLLTRPGQQGAVAGSLASAGSLGAIVSALAIMPFYERLPFLPYGTVGVLGIFVAVGGFLAPRPGR